MDEYNDTQARILRSLHKNDKRRLSTDLKDDVQDEKSISRNGIDKQIQHLIDSGEVEVVEKRGTNLGKNIYGLTDEGEAPARRCAAELQTEYEAANEDLIERVVSLEEQVADRDQLQEQINALRGKVRELEQDVGNEGATDDDVAEKVEKVGRGLQRLKGRVEDLEQYHS